MPTFTDIVEVITDPTSGVLTVLLPLVGIGVAVSIIATFARRFASTAR